MAGLNFFPGANQSPEDRQSAGALSTGQSAIQTLSLNLPRILGARAVAPSSILGGRGSVAQGGSASLPSGTPIAPSSFAPSVPSLFAPAAPMAPSAPSLTPSASGSSSAPSTPSPEQIVLKSLMSALMTTQTPTTPAMGQPDTASTGGGDSTSSGDLMSHIRRLLAESAPLPPVTRPIITTGNPESPMPTNPGGPSLPTVPMPTPPETPQAPPEPIPSPLPPSPRQDLGGFRAGGPRRS